MPYKVDISKPIPPREFNLKLTVYLLLFISKYHKNKPYVVDSSEMGRILSELELLKEFS